MAEWYQKQPHRVRFLLDGEDIFHQIHDLLTQAREAYFGFWEADPAVCLDYKSYVSKPPGPTKLHLSQVMLDNENLFTHMLLWEPSSAAKWGPDQKRIGKTNVTWQQKLAPASKGRIKVKLRRHKDTYGSWHQKFIVFKVPMQRTPKGTKNDDKKYWAAQKYCYPCMIIGTNLQQPYVDLPTHPYNAAFAKQVNCGLTQGYFGWHDAGVLVLGPLGLELLQYFCKFDHSVTIDQDAFRDKLPPPLDQVQKRIEQSSIYEYGRGATFEPVSDVRLLRNDYDAVDYETSKQQVAFQRFEISDAYVDAIRAAQKEVYIESFYVKDTKIISALAEAMERKGVSVYILTSGPGRSLVGNSVFNRYCRSTLDLVKKSKSWSGDFEMKYPVCRNTVKDLFHAEKAIFVHSKLMIVDRKVMIIGSANFCERSTTMDAELSVQITDPSFCAKIRQLLKDHNANDMNTLDVQVRGHLADKLVAPLWKST